MKRLECWLDSRYKEDVHALTFFSILIAGYGMQPLTHMYLEGTDSQLTHSRVRHRDGKFPTRYIPSTCSPGTAAVSWVNLQLRSA